MRTLASDSLGMVCFTAAAGGALADCTRLARYSSQGSSHGSKRKLTDRPRLPVWLRSHVAAAAVEEEVVEVGGAGKRWLVGSGLASFTAVVLVDSSGALPVPVPFSTASEEVGTNSYSHVSYERLKTKSESSLGADSSGALPEPVVSAPIVART